MDSLEVELAGAEEIDENSEYDALNDETFGNAEDTGVDDWEQEHEKFAIIEENFKKFNTLPDEEKNSLEIPERPKLKSLEEIERDLMLSSQQNKPQDVLPAQQVNHRESILYNSILQPSPSPQEQLPRPIVYTPSDPRSVNVDPSRLLAQLGITGNAKTWDNAQHPPTMNHQPIPSPAPAHPFVTPPLPGDLGELRPGLAHLPEQDRLHERLPQPLMHNRIQERVLAHLPEQDKLHERLPHPMMHDRLVEPERHPFNHSDHDRVNVIKQDLVNHDERNPLRIHQERMTDQAFHTENQPFQAHDRLDKPFQAHDRYGENQERSDHMMRSDDREMDEDYDPYAGLMNTRERRWLANIQVMQLEGDDPDYDFYFTEYQKRHGLQHRNSNSDKYNGMHAMSDSPKLTYVPLQFENSLGKVQVGSVQAPRKVIDREIFSNGTVSPPGGEHKAKPRKKLKHILLELEYLYAALQRLDAQASVLATEAATPGLRILQRRPAQPPPLEVASSSEHNEYPNDPATLMGYFLKDRDHFDAYMSIRKGKVLGYRLLRLRQDDRFWLMLFQDFRLLVTRDQAEEILLTYLPLLRSWLQTRGSWEVLCCILPALGEEEEMDFAITNKFGMSVIASIIVTAECLYNTNSPISKEQHELYVKFIITLIDRASQHKTELERPVMGIDTKTLESNFYRIDSHFFRVHQRIDASKKAIVFNALALPTYQKKKNKMKI